MRAGDADMALRAASGETDDAFDCDGDMRRFFDFEQGELRRPAVVREVRTYRKVGVDLSSEMAEVLDAYAARVGVDLQSLVKAWVWERLQGERERDARLGAAPVSVKGRK